MPGGNGEGCIIRNENDVMLGVVPEFVRAPTVMCHTVITRRNSGADGLNDLQVLCRVGVDVRHLNRAIAVPCPEFPVWSYQHTVRAWAICGRGAATARRRPSHASNTAYVYIVLGVDYIHAEVRSVGEIVPLCSRIYPRNVSARDRVARNRDHAYEVNGSL